MEKFLDKAIDIATTAGSKLLLALLVFIVGRLIIKKLLKIFQNSKAYGKMEATLASFLMNFIKIVLHVVLVISIIGILGVPMASVITVLATCGVAIGMALQGALANIAGGIMLMIFRPFRVGDYVAATDTEGVVKEVSLFYTVLNTIDNKEVTIPNGALMNANISNYSSEDLRRVDLPFNLTGNDIEKVQEVIYGVIEKEEKALKEPAPFVSPLAGIPGGLEYTVRVWTKPEDYWDLHFALMKDIPTALAEAGIGGPEPATKVVMNG